MNRKVRANTREEDINFLVKIINKGEKLNKYNRLLKNDLFPEEDFNTIKDELMEYFIIEEDYEKCAVLKKLNN